uniref:Conjugal transfer protein TraD n=2 Tax=Polaromonas sp. H1N TaxID=1840283 RepID=A0A2S1FI57_9BURK|nr:conjugal transfer protein TraD [Polaromonas sp. H1N]
MQLDAWTVERIAHLKSLKSRTEQQELLVLLSEKKDEPKNDKKLSALIKFEKASVRAAKARQAVNNLLDAEKKSTKEADRKARNHRLIQQGLLIDFAGLEAWDHAELLGALMSTAKSESIPEERRADWKRIGDSLISSKEQKL